MTESEKNRYIRFLWDKLARIDEALKEVGGGDDGYALGHKFMARYDATPAKSLKIGSLRSFDSEMELMARAGCGRARIDRIATELKAIHGFGRIGQDPHRLIDRAVKRGKIVSYAKLDAALDYLAENESSSDPRVGTLQGLVNEAEATMKSRL